MGSRDLGPHDLFLRSHNLLNVQILGPSNFPILSSSRRLLLSFRSL